MLLKFRLLSFQERAAVLEIISVVFMGIEDVWNVIPFIELLPTRTELFRFLQIIIDCLNIV